jgi:diacylglycerol O-acyltransferase
MSKIKQLNEEDVLFVAGETKTVYQHTAGLVILDTRESPDFGFDTFREKVIERISQVPHFHWRLHEVPMGLDLPYWVEDENFSYDHHIKRIALPSPGDKFALSEVACHLYSKHLDRSRPLWEIWLIEGLEGGEFAILQKIHHCMMDGQGANKLGEILCDFEPDPPPFKVESAIARATAGRLPEEWERSVRTAMHLTLLPSKLAKGIYEIAVPKVLDLFKSSTKPARQAPPLALAAFNAEISGDRSFVWGSLPLDSIKAVKNRFDVTINDVVLALVGGAMRKYLLEHAELPEESLRAMMAISLRGEGDEEFSNKVTNMPVTLATDVHDPIERLESIHEEAERAKREARKGHIGAMEVFQMMPPIVITTLMGSLPPEQTPEIMGANLVVSNIRGSSAPMYVAGARMQTMFPLSLLANGLSINFTCLSYMGKIDFGVALAPELFPEPWTLIDGLESSLADYLPPTDAAPDPGQ